MARCMYCNKRQFRGIFSGGYFIRNVLKINSPGLNTLN
ncbi:MAG: hypothetical protein AVDCRST_MAG95-4091 [uncultured Adhaeribacter sp.]|uniref:Uncharacterized protein n=1 Tax=uncultured Adhaeribacter sp. TaxID=448109 RepID=A0A6J4K022_9BACT|nr:MAG: hypothetical protein AVDCRST_MAG95-4091 [uncultured Adhaeribacter sp.]